MHKNIRKKVIIIGSGMGGLAAALRLSQHGFMVTVLEKQARLGGRSNIIIENGYRVDTGPTILVMKEMLEDTYQAIGENFIQRLNLLQIDPNYRIYFHDNSYIDLYSNMAQLAAEIKRLEPLAVERLFRFIGESAKKYELARDFIDRNYERFTDLVNPRALFRLLRTGAHQNLYHSVKSHFVGNEKLSKAFSFHSMFLGLSPFDALAMYSMITYADLALGMWYPQGGIYRIVEDMVSLAEERGVTFQVNSEVEEIMIDEHQRAFGVRIKGGEEYRGDIILSNADLPYTYQKLIPPEKQPSKMGKKLQRKKYACSGYLLYLGVNKVLKGVRHQSIYFSEDYQGSLEAIFNKKELPEEISFHLSIPTVTDPSLAPEGHSLIYVLAPMPNLSAAINWGEAASLVREKIIAKLEELIDREIRKHIVWQKEYTPLNFQNDFNAVLGTAFGSLSHNLFQSAYFRPHNKAYDIKGLYFVGQGTYPGIGMPMVHLSAKLVTERIIKECTQVSP